MYSGSDGRPTAFEYELFDRFVTLERLSQRNQLVQEHAERETIHLEWAVDAN